MITTIVKVKEDNYLGISKVIKDIYKRDRNQREFFRHLFETGLRAIHGIPIMPIDEWYIRNCMELDAHEFLNKKRPAEPHSTDL